MSDCRPDRYTPRGEWNWNEWKREDPEPATVLLCAILNNAVQQFENDMPQKIKNMLLYGQPERPSNE